jgi:flagellar basal-body rod protein FlgC
MSTFDAIDSVAASGMAAQRLRVQLAAANIANSETTRTPEGGPYRKKEPVFQELLMGATLDGTPVTGVQVAGIQASSDPFISKYDPNHPDADANGIVQYPNVNPVEAASRPTSRWCARCAPWSSRPRTCLESSNPRSGPADWADFAR